MYYAAFHWARKLIDAWNLIFTSFPVARKLVFFPVGNIVPLKSEVVFPSGKLGILRAPRLPTRKYEFPSPMECSIIVLFIVVFNMSGDFQSYCSSACDIIITVPDQTCLQIFIHAYSSVSKNDCVY